jgi:hypothetical protein
MPRIAFFCPICLLPAGAGGPGIAVPAGSIAGNIITVGGMSYMIQWIALFVRSCSDIAKLIVPAGMAPLHVKGGELFPPLFVSAGRKQSLVPMVVKSLVSVRAPPPPSPVPPSGPVPPSPPEDASLPPSSPAPLLLLELLPLELPDELPLLLELLPLEELELLPLLLPEPLPLEPPEELPLPELVPLSGVVEGDEEHPEVPVTVAITPRSETQARQSNVRMGPPKGRASAYHARLLRTNVVDDVFVCTISSRPASLRPDLTRSRASAC